jgi:release factor glutamine methyltransferase
VGHTVTGSSHSFASAVDRLTAAGCVAAAEEAEELVAAARDDATLQAWISRREEGEPLAWITGSVVFCGHVIRVDPGVYVPRIQSEDLARRAASLLVPGGAAADLCTGTGAVARFLGVSSPGALVVGVDIDMRAAACARRNGVHAVQGDLGQTLRSGAFDVVTAVAPYVPTDEMRLLPADVQRYEPQVALDGGGDGLDVVRRTVSCAGRLLRPGGWLLTEVGGDQDRDVTDTLMAHGFGRVQVWYDADGDLRGVAAQRLGPTS